MVIVKGYFYQVFWEVVFKKHGFYNGKVVFRVPGEEKRDSINCFRDQLLETSSYDNIYIYIYIYIIEFAAVASAWMLQSFVVNFVRRRCYLPHRNRWALEMAARARQEPQGRSKWLLELSEPQGGSKWLLQPARSRSGVRNGCSRLPRSRRGGWCSD